MKREKHPRHIWLKTGVLALLLLVVGFATVAKNSQYLPQSHPAHYVNIASKMKVAPSPLVFEEQPLDPVARVVPSTPARLRSERDESETPSVQTVNLSLCLQYRSPPASNR